MSRTADLYFWEGEIPDPTTFRYEDKDGKLITSIAGATLTAKCKIDSATEFDVSCTNNGDGTGTVDWPDPSKFVLVSPAIRSEMRVDIQVVQAPKTWFLPRWTAPIKKRS